MPIKSLKKSSGKKSLKRRQEQKTRPKMKKHIVKTKATQSTKEQGEKLTIKGREPRNEIEKIFALKKRKRIEDLKKTEQQKKEGSVKAKKEKKMRMIEAAVAKEDGGSVVEQPSRSRRMTKDGFVIYTEEEIGFGKANVGGTRLCPFDCDCCF